MCRPIKRADRQTNHVVARTGKVLAATRAHLSCMELMVVLSFSGLRGVGHFVKGLLKRWFAHKSSNPKMPSVCVCQVYDLNVLRRSHFTRAHVRTGNERSLRTATANSLALTSNQAAPSAASHLPRAAPGARAARTCSAATTEQRKRRSENGAATTWRSNNGAAATAQRQRGAATTRRIKNDAATTAH